MPILPILLLAALPGARAQTVEDGSGAAIGPADTRTILDMVARHLKEPDARVTALRRGEGAVVCGSVDVKNRMGLYTGPRGFVADLADAFFGRVPEGPELLSPSRPEDYRAMERTRQLYFKMCLS
ncbi:hypothetical protein [Methylobacterium segetis]|uniref:hypothetical protein n=1 Tax=Methylobacterium segetis TaxID=2488750 RepID=UPI001FDF53AC|nr:hypothetical protein [Methylobacterium segetis]